MSQNKGIWTVLIGALVVFVGAGIAVWNGFRPQDIALVGFIAFGSTIVLFAGAVLYQIGISKIELQGIIAEPRSSEMGSNEQPKASLSRFQFLVFTFVVAGLFLMLSIEAGQFVDIPNNVLVLIGLSGTGYLAGKVTSRPPGTETPEDPKAKAARLNAEAEAAKRAADEAVARAEAAEAAAAAAD